MTQQDAAQQWLAEARDELEAARILRERGKYRQALFLCHLAVEKALKGAHIAEKDDVPPKTHDLIDLAQRLKREWTENEKEDLRFLSRFVIDARYADPPWTEEYATEEHATHWVERCEYFLSKLQDQ
jgi:HEPN domain-containing protein